jgi:hypothetical protein
MGKIGMMDASFPVPFLKKLASVLPSYRVSVIEKLPFGGLEMSGLNLGLPLSVGFIDRAYFYRCITHGLNPKK